MNTLISSQQRILSLLLSVAGVIERRNTNAILSNVLIQQQGQTCTLTGTDSEIQMRNSAELEQEAQEIFSTTLSAKKLIDILRTIAPEQIVKLEEQDGKVVLRAGKSRFTLQSLPSDDFPLIKSPDTSTATTEPLQISQKNLKQLLQLTSFSMAVQDIRHYLNGMLLQITVNDVQTIATDGHRLAYAKSPRFNTDADAAPAEANPAVLHEVILPRKTVQELLRLLDDNSETPVELQFFPNQAIFRINELELISRLIDGKFPDYNRVIPQNHEQCITVSRNTLQSALQRTAVMMSEKFRGIQLKFEAGLLQIHANNNEQEEASDELDIDYNGPSIEIGFNVNYLIDVLSNVQQDMVELHLQDSNSSALITCPELANFKYVVMPMRI